MMEASRDRADYEEPMSGRIVGRDAIIDGFVKGSEGMPGWQFVASL